MQSAQGIPEPAEEDRSMLAKRYHVIKELIQSEFSYVADVKTLVDRYLNPLEAAGILEPQDVGAIFSNIVQIRMLAEQLYKGFKSNFMQAERLGKVDPSHGGNAELGDCFLQTADFLKMYFQYSVNHDNALEVHKQRKEKITKYSKFLKGIEEDCGGVNLEAYLIKPIQRLCKYPLLFRELLSSTPKHHPDYMSVLKTYEKVQEITIHVNAETKKQQTVKILESINKIVKDMPDKILEHASDYLFNSEVTGIEKNCSKNRDQDTKIHIYIFQEQIIVTRIKNHKVEKWLYTIDVDDMIEALPAENENNCCVELKTKSGSYIYELDTPGIRTKALEFFTTMVTARDQANNETTGKNFLSEEAKIDTLNARISELKSLIAAEETKKSMLKDREQHIIQFIAEYRDTLELCTSI